MRKRVSRTALRKIRRILAQVNALAEKYAAFTDEELQAMTPVLKKRIQEDGETTGDVLPDAFAVCREAAKRVLGKYPYDVQVMGGIVLEQGKIAEMKTGEGKTLVATMPMYLNALTGHACFLVTMNNYLAARDGEEMSELYEFLGLTCAIGVSTDPKVQFKTEEKKQIYAADIVYTTDSAVAFDYLFDNLAKTPEERYFREFYYVIIDEVDSVLLDNAQTPLVISGAPKVQSNLYEIADYFVSTLVEKKDYKTEDDQVWLTPDGIVKAQRFFGMEDLFSEDHFAMVRHIYLALKAHAGFERDKQYVVDDGEVDLLDSKTGRIMKSSKLRGGQHQAIEAKEHVKITSEKRSMAAITYSDFYNMFPKKGGMTGTGVDNADEFRESYGMGMVVIPPNHKKRRIDYPDVVCTSLEQQIKEAFKEVVKVHETGQPILLITASIAMSDVFSELLLQKGIPHNQLNAYNIAKEAEIIREAGQKDAVTVATVVAGRGTDIRLGEGVEELGGLAVIGVGRMENIRLELQARGRAGRQGDPGYSRFYVSCEDDIVIEHGAKWLKNYRNQNRTISKGRLRRAILAAQQVNEDQGLQKRKSTVEYSSSMLNQRNVIYEMRSKLMEEVKTDKAYYLDIASSNIDDFLAEHTDDLSEYLLERFVLDNICYRLDEFPSEADAASPESAKQYLLKLTDRELTRKIKSIPLRTGRETFFRKMTLKAIDDNWVEQVDYMQQLRIGLQGRKYTQRNIMFDFHQEAYKAFIRMGKQIRKDMMRNILLGDLFKTPAGELKVLYP